jgi:hypothetical protein
MFSRIHEKLGTAGFVIAIVALVAALTGTAIAAAGLNSTQKKEVKKIAKKVAKQGPAGPAGAAGKDGTNGANGANGTNGTSGAAGKSVKTGSEPAGANCTEGGIWVEVEGSGTKEYVCDGESATSGGPQTALQAGETQTGVWSFLGINVFGAFSNISFPLRVEDVPTFHFIQAPPATNTDPECPGSASDPQAEPGALCVYAVEMANAGTGPYRTYADNQIDLNSGQIMEFKLDDKTAEAYGAGSWAVQACPADPAPC